MSPITNLTEFIQQEFEPGLSSEENLVKLRILFIDMNNENPTKLCLVEYRNEALT